MLSLDPLREIRRTSAEQLARILSGPPSDRLMHWGWWNETRNFGDWIGPLLYLSLTGRLPVHATSAQVTPPHKLFVTCGSILQKISKPDVAVIWGSGVISESDSFERPAEVHAVRGPCTQEVLDRQGYHVPEVVGDPGLCLPLVLDAGPREITHKLGFVSHIVDREFWRKNAEYLPKGVKLIHLDRPIAEVVADITSCEAIISSSLHGVIVSHAYGIPASVIMPCTRPLLGDGFKFRDYYRSVGMEFTARDQARAEFPLRVNPLMKRAVLPSVDLAKMARDLMAVCPFAPLGADRASLTG